MQSSPLKVNLKLEEMKCKLIICLGITYKRGEGIPEKPAVKYSARKEGISIYNRCSHLSSNC